MARELGLGLTSLKKFILMLLLLVACLLVLGTRAVAQEDTVSVKTHYLFKDPGSKGAEFSTFYGEISPGTAFSTINSTIVKVFVMEFGIHLNRKFSLGYYLSRSPKTTVANVPDPTDPEYQDWIDSGVRLDQLPTGATQAFIYFVQSGLNLAYMHKSDRTIFWRTGLRVGIGKLQLTSDKRQIFNLFNTTIFEKRVLNLNPEIGVGVNLRSWWRLHLDLGYHFIFAGSSDEIIDPTLFNGTTFKFGFAFGNFSK